MVTCPLMHDLWVNILSAWQAQSTLEMVAVVAAILYLVLAIRENIWCWLFAFISTGLFIYLYHSVSLFSESLLNVFYLAMAVYGWRQWSQGETNNHHKPIIKWSWQKHLQLILLTGLCWAFPCKAWALIMPIGMLLPPVLRCRPLFWWCGKCLKTGTTGWSSIPCLLCCVG